MSELSPTGDPEPDPESRMSKVRAGDVDRRLALDILSLAMTKGHLSADEFEERSQKAIAAKTFGELDALTDDLPSQDPASRSVASASSAPAASDADAIRTRIAVMSGSELKGRAVVGSNLNAFALMGGVEIDLRTATFTSPTLDIRATAIMGGIEIVVPENATVRITGTGVMGGFGGEQGAEGPGTPAGPTITISGLALMGGVEVTRRPTPDQTSPSPKKN